MKLYGIKACDTCRKAFKSLASAGREVEFIDVRATPVAAETLQNFQASFGDQILNTRSTTWRGLSEEERQKTPLALLVEHPTLMKRPVIETDEGALHLGWKKDVQEALL